jgi:hypothetical protein
MREYRELIVTIFVIFGLTLIGAFFSPTFSEQKSYLELFMLFGSLLFIFSVLVILATIGFSSFALYLAIVVAAIMLLLGIWSAFLAVSMTYGIWGFIFSIELLLVDHDVPTAISWFQERYDFQSFRGEYYAFYPMILFVYILVEFIPSLFDQEKSKRFSPHQVFEKMRNILNRSK